MLCPSCGKEIPDTAKSCQFCGRATKGSTRPRVVFWLVCVGVLLIALVWRWGRSEDHLWAGNEASAVGSLRQYVNGCISYSNDHPKFGYPPNLSVLGPAPAGEGLLDQVLAPPGGVKETAKSSYVFLYTAGIPDRTGVITSFSVSARPVRYVRHDHGGRRSFFVDETGVIRFTTEDRAATAHDSPIG